MIGDVLRNAWHKSCPGCAYRKDRGGWPFWIGAGLGKSAVTVAICRNLVVPVQRYWWDTSYARQATQLVMDRASSAGMKSCDPLKQEPTSDVFARGTAQDRGKAVAVGTIKNPTHIFLSVRSTNRAMAPYVEWTLTCTNGTRTETTSDQGKASLPLYIELPIGIPGARSCTAAASAVSLHAANVQINGTLSVELLNKPWSGVSATGFGKSSDRGRAAS